MPKNIGELTVEVKTGIFQKKLRAIAKHAAALAEELEQIDECREGEEEDA